jgi:molecular chaperone IbpA
LPRCFSARAPLAKPDPIPTSKPRGPLADAQAEANLRRSYDERRIYSAPEQAYLQHLALPKEDNEMRHFDLSPLYRSTVGFDRLFNMIDQAAGFEAAPSYPPYNIERTGENAYRISVAVAGFAVNDLAIETKENGLTIRGSSEREPEGSAENREILYQGIAARAFERRFQLADHVQVTGASLENGLLHVDLLRELPDAQKARQIPIAAGGAKSAVSASKAA